MGGKVVSSGGFPRVLFLGKTDKNRPSYSHFCVFDYNLLTVGKTALILLDALNAACLFTHKNETYVNIRSCNLKYCKVMQIRFLLYKASFIINYCRCYLVFLESI